MNSSANIGSLPSGMTIDHTGGRLLITYRWLSIQYVLNALGCLVLDAFTGFWFYMFITRSPHWVLFLLLSPLVLLAVLTNYNTVAGFVNSTQVAVSNGMISITHGPLRTFRKNITIQARWVLQLFIEEHVFPKKKGKTVVYSLNAMTGEKKKVTLVARLESYDTALSLERQVESYLGIQDRKVVGEAEKDLP